MTETRSYTVIPHAMPGRPERSWWQRLWRKVLRRTDPPPVQPPGTAPLTITTRDGSRVLRYYFPAAEIRPDDNSASPDPLGGIAGLSHGQLYGVDPESLRLYRGDTRG